MQRGSNNTVTEAIPILMPCSSKERDGYATFLFEMGAPQPVRVVTAADFSLRGGRCNAVAAMPEEEHEIFKAVLVLLDARKNKDTLAAQKARQHVTRALEQRRADDEQSKLALAKLDDLEFGRVLISVFGLNPGQEKEALERLNGYRLGPMAQSGDDWLLSQLISHQLGSVKFVLWWAGDLFRPAFYCPDPKAAIYTAVLIKVAVKGQGWGVCPYCGEFFVQKRSDQNYCSISHREAHRVARWRAARVKKLKKGKKHGARKAR